MATADPNRTTARQWLLRSLLVVGTAAFFGLLAGVAVSPAPMRGAELFGVIANKIKGNPGATTVLALAACALLWTSVGILTAIQEWLTARRQAP